MGQVDIPCPECGRVRQASSYSEMDLAPSAEDCVKVEKLAKAIAIERFPDANIVRVDVKGGVDFEFQEPKYHVWVIYDSSFESVPADKTLGFSGILRDKMENEGLYGFPYTAYALKDEVDR